MDRSGNKAHPLAGAEMTTSNEAALNEWMKRYFMPVRAGVKALHDNGMCTPTSSEIVST